ncbi:MAG: hypothetical protein ABJA79_07895 [Parafilimonas sp.]
MLHSINNCENNFLLEEAKEILVSSKAQDWWDDLTDEEKNLLKESEKQYKERIFISHSKLMEQFDEWKKK